MTAAELLAKYRSLGPWWLADRLPRVKRIGSRTKKKGKR